MILLVMSHANGRLSKASYELAAAAEHIADQQPRAALVIGSGVGPVAVEAVILCGCVVTAKSC